MTLCGNFTVASITEVPKNASLLMTVHSPRKANAVNTVWVIDNRCRLRINVPTRK